MAKIQTRPTTALLLTLMTCGACSWSQPPKAKNSLLAPIDIRPALSQNKQGQLLLLQQGDWAYVLSKTPGQTNKFEAGQLIGAYSEEESAPAHLFAITHKRSWGFVLQRLDHNPISTPIDALELGALDPKASKSTCVAEGDYTTQACLTKAPMGTRWSIYPLKSATRTHTSKSQEKRYGAHITRSAMAHVGQDGLHITHIGSKIAPKNWIAIAQRGLYARHPNVTVGHDCAKAPTTSIAGVHHVKTSWNAKPHALHIEAQTYQRAVDVLWSCKRKTLTIPTLWRPTLHGPSGENLGPALLSAQPLKIGALSPSQQHDIAMAGAWVATNDMSMADALLERALHNIKTGDKDTALLIKRAMQTAGLVRPEAALRMGWLATSSSWNREEDIAYQLGLAAVYTSMGLQRQGLVAESRTAEIRNRKKESPLRGWLAWRTATMLLEEGRLTYSKDIKSMETKFGTKDAPLWMSAIYLQMLNKNLLPPKLLASLERRLRGQKASNLWQGLRLKDVDRPCPKTGPCVLDSYGRRLKALYNSTADKTQLMQHAPKIQVQPGWMRNLNDDSFHPLHLATLIHIQRPQQMQQALRLLASKMGSGVGGAQASCRHQASFSQLGVAYEQTLAKEDRNTLYGWLLMDVFPKWCAKPNAKTLANFVPNNAPENKPRADIVVSFIEGLLQGKGATKNHQALLELGAQISGTHRVGGRCFQWNMALAYAQYNARKPQNVSPYLVRANNCGGGLKPKQRTQAGILAAFSRYERHGNYGYELAPEVSKAVAQQPGTSTCQGLEDRRPAVERHLDASIINAAKKLTIKKETEDGTLSLMTSSSAITQARADLVKAGRLISEANVAKGVSLLAQAQASFQRAKYTPGIRTINWIEQELFGGNLADTSASRSWVSTRLKDGQAQLLYNELSQNTSPDLVQRRVLVGLALLLDGPKGALKWIKKHGGPTAYKTLCKP